MATNAVYEKLGTRIKFIASGGDVLFTPKNIASGAGRISTRADLGAFPRPALYRYYGETQVQATTPVAGNLVRMYLSFWDDDGTPGDPWGDVGATDAAFATEAELWNLQQLRPIVVEAAAADTVFAAGGLIQIPYRYVSLVWWNASGASLTNDDAEHWFALTPVYPDIQAAA